MRWQGHFWTLAGTLHGREPAWEPWSTRVPDETHGSVRLTGRLSPVPGARTIVVAVHGLGGHADTRYQRRAAAAAVAAGASCLRLALRGADRSGEDVYHAGRTADLEAALASPEVARHERVHLLGDSLGGHVALRLAAAGPPALEVRWPERGGHVGFPGRLRLGEEAPRGLEPQVLSWLLRRCAPPCTALRRPAPPPRGAGGSRPGR